MIKLTTALLTGSALLLFTACGGGGSSSGGGSTPSSSDVYVDNEIGLMWQDDAYTEFTNKPWLEEATYNACYDTYDPDVCYDYSGDTATTYCSNMTLGGYADWRLPTKDELKYLYMSDKYLDLQYGLDLYYWTSTTRDNSGFGLTQASTGFRDWGKDSSLYVRCVRSL